MTSLLLDHPLFFSGTLFVLLLGFTQAMALPRFDLRKQLVLGESNAIGTAALRAELLPQAHLVNAIADRIPHLLYVWLWPTQKILAGGRRHSAHDRAIVMGLLADLDSPRSGFIQVDLRSMKRLQQDLQNGAPITSAAEPAKH
jgi:hypothetical protein